MQLVGLACVEVKVDLTGEGMAAMSLNNFVSSAE